MLLPTLLGGIVRWTLSLLNGVSFSIICNRPFRAFQCSDTPRFKCAQNSGALPNRVDQWCSIKQVSFLASNVVRLPILQITSFSPPHKRGVDSGEAVEGFAQKKCLPENKLRTSASSFHWLSSSIFTVRWLLSRIGNTSSHLHYMMFQTIQTIYFL